MECKICKEDERLKAFTAREMMFGLKEEFLYIECESCNCLQIVDFPQEMEKYYPANYYSYSSQSSKKKSSFFEFLKQKRNYYAVFNRGLIGELAYIFFPSEQIRSLSEISLSKNSKILDVGCGNGTLLLELKKLGFDNLSGADPFIEKDIWHNETLFIQKKQIHQITENQDVIMFHHSFEHLPDPLETLHSVSKLLNKGGFCIIRVPTVSYAWKYYKENWVQLDAPRHFFIHSKDSIKYLANKAALSLDKTIYDSTSFQFWGSEQYIKDIPLINPKSYAINPKQSIFTKSEIRNFELKAKQLNEKGEGDTCLFILRKN